jgi:hypothetical protein
MKTMLVRGPALGLLASSAGKIGASGLPLGVSLGVAFALGILGGLIWRTAPMARSVDPKGVAGALLLGLFTAGVGLAAGLGPAALSLAELWMRPWLVHMTAFFAVAATVFALPKEAMEPAASE